MREITDMVGDLEVAMKHHAVKALDATRKAAESMAEAAKQASAPMYGYVVEAKATHMDNKSTVRVRIYNTRSGIGKVHGGEKAVAKKTRENIDAVARADGMTGGAA